MTSCMCVSRIMQILWLELHEKKNQEMGLGPT